MSKEKIIYSVFEARTRLNLNESQMRHLIKTKKIDFRQVKKGHPIRFTEKHLKEFEDSYRRVTGRWENKYAHKKMPVYPSNIK
tara:strand:+ start:471 stop:719 length:249 start_codon:yes stop_codon:yes gene_type:complete